MERRHSRGQNYNDDHHIVHNRQEWELRPEGKLIRQTPSLIVHIPRSEHDYIHANSPAIPLLGIHALQRTANFFRPSGDTLTDISRLQSSIERAVKHPKSHEIETRLGHLAIESLDIQRLLIKEILKKIY